jgi:hypothetical protein
MEQTLSPRRVEPETLSFGKNEASSSGVSWAAVTGGAFVAAALSLILLTLGTGLGFSSVSPWANKGASASAVGAGAIVWLIVTQIVASAFGGYLAGRLRTKWAGLHTDEVYFRDTAHGLLVWAVGMVITAGFLTTAAASFAGAAQKTSATNGSSAQESTLDPNAYFVDSLLRSSGVSASKSENNDRAEVGRTFGHDLQLGDLPADDKTYLSQTIASHTGLSQPDAEKRLSSVFSDAQDTAERTRKALAHLSLWLFVALLSGAFSASYAGTIGGKQRDHVIG